MISRRYQLFKQALTRRQPDLTVLMENVEKPHNLSAIMRTCDAVGILGIHVIHPEEELPILNNVARGTEKRLQITKYTEVKPAITQIRQQEFNIYAAHLSDRAIDYRQIDYTQPSAIILGTEKWGVSSEAADLADGHILIPMLGMVQSLNVSVAAAVILFEAQRQRLQAGFYDQMRINPEIYHQAIFEWTYPELAAQYRQHGKPYPNLDDNGAIVET